MLTDRLARTRPSNPSSEHQIFPVNHLPTPPPTNIVLFCLSANCAFIFCLRPMISVSLQGISVRFGDVQVLENIDLTVQQGELFFLLGPSGCGKTTLLRTIAGFCQPNSGSILFDGQSITHFPPEKRRTAMVFQNYALWPHMNVEQNVAFGLHKLPKAEARKMVQEALENVQMAEYAKRSIHQLSGGQQQRVALARALVMRPRCLLLDEPLSNLDAQLRHQMRFQIRQICRRFNLTAIYVTHDQKEALSIADRMAVLDKGKIRQIGTPREVYQQPRSKFVAEFMGETNFIPGTLTHLTTAEAIVHTAMGDFHALPPETALRPGDNVLLSIRPECWHLTSSPRNCLAGTVSESVYLGETIQHRFSAEHQEITISETNPRPNYSARHASVDPQDVVILPA